MDTVVSAADNPQLANELVNKALTTQVSAGVPEVKPAPLPPEANIQLSAGLLDPITGEIAMDAEIRELNGVDEEAISRINDMGKSLLAILQRGVVSIGGKKATQEMLDDLLAGDRELLLVAIRNATFGNTIELSGPCPECNTSATFEVDLKEDVEIKRLEDPVNDRSFVVNGKTGPIKVNLPTGHAQKKLVQNSDKTVAELDTLLLRECVASIGGTPMVDVRQVLNMGIQDRRKVTSEIAERTPGPRLADIKKACPSCGQEVPLPLTVADTFRL